MSRLPSVSVSQEEPDALLARLQDNYTRQKRLVAAQKRKQADIELQAAAAYYSDPPITLELLSDKTAGLFTELERLIETQQEFSSTTSKEVLLLQRIRTAVNRELRQSMAYIEEGYHSGFEKLLRQTRVGERRESLLVAPAPPTSAPGASTSPAAATEARSAAVPPSSAGEACGASLSVQEALSEYLSLTAESLAVLLQCETVRVYLYDAYGNLQCAAQFPYRARRADPAQSNSLALMTVRELHETVCHDRLAVNGMLRNAGNAPTAAAGRQVSGVEDVQTCLIFPIVASQGVSKAHGMIHAVNKRFPVLVNLKDGGTVEAPVRGFSVEDEVLVANAARLVGAALSRYPQDAFSNSTVGEAIRRGAHPNDPSVCSLTAHLLPALYDPIEEAADVGQEALNRALPTLVYRAPVDTVYGTRIPEDVKRRRAASALGSEDGSATVSTVAFRLRCMNELWESSRDDNTSLHRQYRELEEEAQQARLLLRNVLNGVATARCMPIPHNVSRYLQTLEVYGRSGRNGRLAAFISDTMLTVSQNRGSDGATTIKNSSEATPKAELPNTLTVTDLELRRLQHDHARLNTVTVSSLHYDGPDGVPSYTSNPAQKREQIRFIDELQRNGMTTGGVAQITPGLYRGQKAVDGGDMLTSSAKFTSNSLPRLAGPLRSSAKDSYPFQRPFKLT